MSSLVDIKLEAEKTTAQLQAQKVSPDAFDSFGVYLLQTTNVHVWHTSLIQVLFVFKGFSMDIMRHKDAVDEITKSGEAMMNSKDETEKQALKVNLKKYE